MIKTELKPCPFCGGEAHIHMHDRFGIECEECGMGLGCIKETEVEAIKAWNKRQTIKNNTSFFETVGVIVVSSVTSLLIFYLLEYIINSILS